MILPATMSDSATLVGIGWRQPHDQALREQQPRIGFIEVHSENFFAMGGPVLEVLRAGRAAYPVSLHGVGLGLGSAAGLDSWHLEHLARLVEQIEPHRVSDHASFARAPLAPGAPVLHAADLLPVAFTPAALDIMAANVQRVQDRLRRRLLVENLSAYLGWTDDSMSEAEFFNALTRRSGCGVLLDLNNLVVNALNAGHDPVPSACAFVDALDAAAVGEIHLAGYSDQEGLLVDDHSSRVGALAWTVFRHAVQRMGPLPTLIEWDTNLPALDVLLDEAMTAATILAPAMLVNAV
jgi:uncharacterized protein (UPF0276 family)